MCLAIEWDIYLEIKQSTNNIYNVYRVSLYQTEILRDSKKHMHVCMICNYCFLHVHSGLYAMIWHREDFATFMCASLVSNLLVYMFFYIVMKV